MNFPSDSDRGISGAMFSAEKQSWIFEAIVLLYIEKTVFRFQISTKYQMFFHRGVPILTFHKGDVQNQLVKIVSQLLIVGVKIKLNNEQLVLLVLKTSKSKTRENLLPETWISSLVRMVFF